MRRILVDHARKRQAAKRGADAARVTLDEAHTGVEPVDVDVLALHECLERLEALDPRQCRIVELRFFGGLSVEETASVLERRARPSPATGTWRGSGFAASSRERARPDA